GVFCCTDSLAIGALAALAAAGLRVPTDVALVGYDDVAQAAVTVPPLTTVAQPIAAMAERALELLLGVGPPGTSLLAPRLVVRESG
ncbi:MAG TPA: substrate-binding domain-containing protein, partial [Chloroflexota bacterium]